MRGLRGLWGRSSTAFLSLVAERSRASSLTGLPRTALASSHGQASLHPAQLASPAPGSLPNEEPASEKHIHCPAPKAPVGAIDQRVSESRPDRTSLRIPAQPGREVGAPIAPVPPQGPSSGSSPTPAQICSSALLPPERTVPKQYSCRRPQPSGRGGHEVGRWVASTVNGRELERGPRWRPGYPEARVWRGSGGPLGLLLETEDSAQALIL